MDLENLFAQIRKESKDHSPDGREHDKERRSRGDLMRIFDRPVNKACQIDQKQNSGFTDAGDFFFFRDFHVTTLGQKTSILSRPMVEWPFRLLVEPCK